MPAAAGSRVGSPGEPERHVAARRGGLQHAVAVCASVGSGSSVDHQGDRGVLWILLELFALSTPRSAARACPLFREPRNVRPVMAANAGPLRLGQGRQPAAVPAVASRRVSSVREDTPSLR